ncbi:hypothetical protein [Tahibacter caeni]|uniref:hypothetical protein n=1 Tax=Tahibacter caeni TaxID=1453545 RepID=UPI002149322B|nr:hypothetical protein [Tahibacter caeni]
MALPLLMLVLFAALEVFLVLVVGLALLLALGATYAAAGALLLFVGLSALGGLALAALSRRADGPRWSRPIASLWLALATVAELGLSFASRLL